MRFNERNGRHFCQIDKIMSQWNPDKQCYVHIGGEWVPVGTHEFEDWRLKFTEYSEEESSDGIHVYKKRVEKMQDFLFAGSKINPNNLTVTRDGVVLKFQENKHT